MAPRFTEGAPYWVDMSAPDVPATVDFYRRLFGWDAEDLGEESGNYTMLSYRGQQVGAIGPSFNPQADPAWIVYLKSPDAFNSTKAVEAAGGTVRMPPMDVFDQTTVAQFTDPGGAEFAISQPKKHQGAERWGQTGAVTWLELIVRQPEPSLSFYQRVFGWTTRQEAMSDGSMYTLLTAADSREPFGGLHVAGAALPPDVASHWMVYFAVEDCEAVAREAERLGGSRVTEPMTVPEVGTWVTLRDPNRGVFSAMTGTG
ncbi:hypothetical protein LX16_3884 [Stackebrandtia albiflava]|uniref:VOC domain-containing protein n=1 Tax=Stackebrandtia albiflava TaxID=406432 RepID=A0A562UXZ0_9ACTN|nr:VOC family protein [Stackebrandtia albiflava]TWJ10467.1 hypothetical protein LX16_3884 [Stackebrandtia albiflava]